MAYIKEETHRGSGTVQPFCVRVWWIKRIVGNGRKMSRDAASWMQLEKNGLHREIKAG